MRRRAPGSLPSGPPATTTCEPSPLTVTDLETWSMRTGSNRCSFVCKSQTVSMLWSCPSCGRHTPREVPPVGRHRQLRVPVPRRPSLQARVSEPAAASTRWTSPRWSAIATTSLFGTKTAAAPNETFTSVCRVRGGIVPTGEHAEQRRLGDRARGDPMSLDGEEARRRQPWPERSTSDRLTRRAGRRLTTLLLGRFALAVGGDHSGRRRRRPGRRRRPAPGGVGGAGGHALVARRPGAPAPPLASAIDASRNCPLQLGEVRHAADCHSSVASSRAPRYSSVAGRPSDSQPSAAAERWRRIRCPAASSSSHERRRGHARASASWASSTLSSSAVTSRPAPGVRGPALVRCRRRASVWKHVTEPVRRPPRTRRGAAATSAASPAAPPAGSRTADRPIERPRRGSRRWPGTPRP